MGSRLEKVNFNKLLGNHFRTINRCGLVITFICEKERREDVLVECIPFWNKFWGDIQEFNEDTKEFYSFSYETYEEMSEDINQIKFNDQLFQVKMIWESGVVFDLLDLETRERASD